jgi:hypothetical protein
MANPNAPFGLRPVRHRNGAPFSGGGNLYWVPSSLASSLFIGDPVTLLGGANSATYEGFAPGTLPSVTTITTGDGNPVLGSVISFFPEQATSTIYSLPSTGRGVYIADDPNLEFEIMDDGVATLTTAAVGRNANFNTSTFSGSTTDGVSGATMSTTLSSTSGTTGQLHILGLVMQPNISVGQYGVWRVMINNHSFRLANAQNV